MDEFDKAQSTREFVDEFAAKENLILIDIRDYETFLRDSRKLQELENLGVDNWPGYDDIDWDYVRTGESDE